MMCEICNVAIPKCDVLRNVAINKLLKSFEFRLHKIESYKFIRADHERRVQWRRTRMWRKKRRWGGDNLCIVAANEFV